jgi:GxxExxY protein
MKRYGDEEMERQMDKLTERIIGCVIKVHQTLGPGFLETIYQRALVLELKKAMLSVESEKDVIILYDGQEVGRHRLDLIVESQVAVELKAVEELSRAHYAQVRSYLKATGLHIGLLVNLSKPMADFRRIEL